MPDKEIELKNCPHKTFFAPGALLCLRSMDSSSVRSGSMESVRSGSMESQDGGAIE